MPIKNKKQKEKGKHPITRQLSAPVKPSKKKTKNGLKHSSHSASEIYHFDCNSEVVTENNVDTSPQSSSRPTSPLNFFLPMLEYGFSWPRRKSPFSKFSSESKNVRSPLMSSPDSGYPTSPVGEDYLVSPAEEKEMNLLIDQKGEITDTDMADKGEIILSRIDNKKDEFNSESNLQSGSDSDKAASEFDAIINALDSVIDSGNSDIDNNLSGMKNLSSSDDCEFTTQNDKKRCVQNDIETLNGIIKDGKGTISKRVRFNIDHNELRKTKSCEIYQSVKEPCLFAISVNLVEISPVIDKDTDKCVCTIKDTFQAVVCHHPECTDSNGGHPFLMCRECDLSVHGNPEFSSHLVLDAPKRKIGNIGRGASTPNLQVDDDGCHSDMDVRSQGEGSVDSEDAIDGIFIKKREIYEFRPPPTPTSTELKLKRKKALKQKRRHTDADTIQNSSNELYTDETDDDSDIGDREIRRKSDDLHNGSLAQRALRRQSKSVISDECFTLRFMDVKENDIEIVAATRGISLRNALQPILERRGIGINNVNIFVEASKTPLPLECESFLLGGNTLNIKEKESDGILGRGSTSRQNSGNKNSSTKSSKSSGMSRRESFFGRTSSTLEQPLVKQRRNSLSIPFFSNPAPKVGDGPRMLDDNQPVGSLRSRRGINLSIDDTVTIPSNVSSSVSPQGTISYSEGRRIKDRSKLQNLFSPMGSKDRERHEQLSELLNTYSNNGIPPMPELLTLGKPTYEDEIFHIEPHWSSIVENASMLTKRQHDQQEAIWELLTTEIQYIRTLRVITDLFMCCLINLQSESLLIEIDTVQMFSNIYDVLNVNCDFWEKYLLKVLQETRENRLPFNPSDMKDGFKKFPELFGPYTKYCEEQKPSSEYMKARYSDNDLFKTFVVWAETQKQCNRLKLTDLLVKPMQRLTKYSLLLQAILRKTEDDRQRKDLLEMIGSVDKFVSYVNSTLRQKHEKERLATIVGKIESYDAVESPNDECLKYLQEYYDNFDLHAPMPGCSPEHTRSLIMQSVLKLKEATSRMDVECLLFTDLLLICKPSKRMEKYKIIKPPMRVDRIIVQELKDKGSFLLMYMNEYHVPISAFTFHADQAAIKVWLDHIRQAQEMYSSARKTSQKDDLSFLVGEVVQEEVIRTTPLHSLSETHNSTVLLSPTTTKDFSEHFTPSPQPSPTGRITPDSGQRPVSENIFESHSQSLKDKSSANNEQSHHRVVQSSYSVPSFSDALVDEKLKIPSSSNVSSANSDSSLPDILDENMRQKLNQRRSSRSEKRYYTADAIQELHKSEEKDASIYKRLSWNFGTKDQNEERQNTLRSKVQSADSIRSIHSSSGVSSTGSLHLSPDGEICEEFEHNNNLGDISTIHESHYMDEDHENELNENDRHKSRSTTDISRLFQELSTGEVKDGISSVDISGSFDKKNYSHAQIMRMKKQLLLSSNVEASEV